MKRISALLSLVFISAFSFAQGTLELKTANGHPMMYYVSLPKKWNAFKSWPVVFILEAAEKEFKKNAERFVDARGDMPFILVAPINTSNGNQGRKDPNVFPYSKETWEYIERVGDCQFNAEGIYQIMLDVQKQFHGEEKILITGFEAGAHDLWSIVFNHPEYLKAAVPVGGNFRNRCVTAGSISNHPAKRDIVIQSMVGSKDEIFGPEGTLYNQWQEAKDLATSHGYLNISEKILPDVAHTPVPKEVLVFFNSLIGK
jgi:hypothetical protein